MVKAPLIAVIRFYQRFLSPLKRTPTCRFLPTCSSYALEAVQRRGALVGTLMALWRILRCNPLFPGGFDPVAPCDHAGNGRTGMMFGAEHGAASELSVDTNRGAPVGAAPTRPRMRPVT